MSKKVAVVLSLEKNPEDWFQIDVRDIDDEIYILGVEHYREDLVLAKTEIVTDKNGLTELRDSLNLMIGDAS